MGVLPIMQQENDLKNQSDGEIDMMKNSAAKTETDKDAQYKDGYQVIDGGDYIVRPLDPLANDVPHTDHRLIRVADAQAAMVGIYFLQGRGDVHIAEGETKGPELHSRIAWKELGYRVPTKEKPEEYEAYSVPGHRAMMGFRNMYSRHQVVKVDPVDAERRAKAAQKAIGTRMRKMQEAMANVDLTIHRGRTNEEVYDLARSTHGGNYQGHVGAFRWSNEKARNAIRHNLTNYEALWEEINRGYTGAKAYGILRGRADDLVNAAYPQFAPNQPEVPAPAQKATT